MTKLRNIIPSMIAKTPMSALDIAQATDRNRNAVRKLLMEMYADKEVHIASWTRASRGPFIAQFLLGAGEDAPPIQKLTNAEICKRYRSTPKGHKVHLKNSRRWYRNNDGAAMRNIERQRAKALKRFQSGGVAAIDPLLAMIMGMAA